MTCSIKNTQLIKNKKNIFCNRKLTSGFSLAEMMVTMGIFMIMTTIMYANYPQLNRVIALQAATSEIGVIIRNAQIYGSSRGGDAVGDGVYIDMTEPTKIVEFLDITVPGSTLNDYGIAQSDFRFTKSSIPDPSSDDKIVNYAKVSGGVIISGIYKRGTSNLVLVNTGTVSVVYVRPNTEAHIYEDPLGVPVPLSELYIETSSGKVANPGYRCITVLKIGQVNVTSGKCSTLY
jgi:type II secretory pathway pseudopilin PulG